MRLAPQTREESNGRSTQEAATSRNVTVEGRLNGDVSADDRVELVAGSTVDGNIKAPKIVVAEGARFRGNVDMGAAKPESASAKK